jgi:exopolysaccharide production protein ExoZ
MRAVKLDAIQVMRLFAALLVVFDHTVANLMAGNQIEVNYPFAFRSGGFGVYIFFLISGFVMAQSTYESFAAPGISKSFLRRRLIRIVPMYWLVTLVLAAKAFATSKLDSLSPVLLSLGFVPYLAADGQVQPINGVGWTLNYEMLFYVIFAFSLVFTRRIGVVLLTAVLLGLVVIGTSLTSLVGTDFFTIAVKFWTDPILLYFLGGVWIGLLRANLERTQHIHDINISTAIVGSLSWIILFVVLLYLGFMPVWLEALFAVALVAAVGMFNCAAQGRVSLFLKKLGDASYSIYLVHLTVVLMVFRVFDVAALSPGPIVILVVAFCASSLAGLIAYRFIEKPLLTYFQQQSGRQVRVVTNA